MVFVLLVAKNTKVTKCNDKDGDEDDDDWDFIEADGGEDLLSIPSMSVFVEHQFSCGQLLISGICNHLTGETTCCLMCLDSWSIHGLIDNDDIVQVTSAPTSNNLK
ncbi:hypothetical protein BT96DRAFT_943687 [Gymnopus androsaceus JB14]|uniref:Uncharacterized protein n=1 Tax=Gymnopus androsaceus JB14 TaxID=1447944 RepID=A0A6A4H7R1_9AGAR|nr:hypothetical protein BT96DRAFT_943687 [Gymnopus androsaceus JB14]